MHCLYELIKYFLSARSYDSQSSTFNYHTWREGRLLVSTYHRVSSRDAYGCRDDKKNVNTKYYYHTKTSFFIIIMSNAQDLLSILGGAGGASNRPHGITNEQRHKQNRGDLSLVRSVMSTVRRSHPPIIGIQ